jgi:hypothetical protein
MKGLCGFISLQNLLSHILVQSKHRWTPPYPYKRPLATQTDHQTTTFQYSRFRITSPRIDLQKHGPDFLQRSITGVRMKKLSSSFPWSKNASLHPIARLNFHISNASMNNCAKIPGFHIEGPPTYNTYHPPPPPPRETNGGGRGMAWGMKFFIHALPQSNTYSDLIRPWASVGLPPP